MTAYKRPDLLISDLARLLTLTKHADRPVQFIVAGQANPFDVDGVAIMNRIVKAAKLPELNGSFAYLPHYNPRTARLLVQGADLWLNTPRPYADAFPDARAGWIDEVDIAPIGWVIPEERPAAVLYDLLELNAAPLFYARDEHGLPVDWIVKMRANIDLIEREFTAARMLDDYYGQLYTMSK